MNPPVLVLITDEFPYGKKETFIENEINFLAAAFDKVIIIPLERTGESQRKVPENVLVYPVKSSPVSRFKLIKQVIKEKEISREFLSNIFSNPLKNKILIRSLQNAINIQQHLETLAEKHKIQDSVFYSYWLNDAAIGIALMQSKSVKIARAHGWDVRFELHKYNYLPLRNFLAEKLNAIFVISENGKTYIQKKTNQNEKIKASKLGIINKCEFREGVDQTKLNIISISNLIPLKRVELIGASIRLLRHNKINWDHFGDGELHDELKNRFPDGTFHGRIGNEDIKNFLNLHSTNSILINTSSTEGIPVSMMEAMSFGIPCIGTKVGGVSEIIKDGINGFLMPPDITAETVAEYIQRYLNLSVEEKELLRLNAYKTWSEEYNAGKNYTKFIEDIKSICNN